MDWGGEDTGVLSLRMFSACLYFISMEKKILQWVVMYIKVVCAKPRIPLDHVRCTHML